jgi:hypothetical protein
VPEILIDSCKPSVSRALRHPLRASDLEKVFTGLCKRDLFLKLFFDDRQHIWQAGRERLREQNRSHILKAHYRPEVFTGSPLREIWDHVADPQVVQATIYPLELLTVQQLNRSELKELLAVQVRELIPNGLPCAPWSLSVDVLLPTAEVFSRGEYDGSPREFAPVQVGAPERRKR